MGPFVRLFVRVWWSAMMALEIEFRGGRCRFKFIIMWLVSQDSKMTSKGVLTAAFECRTLERYSWMRPFTINRSLPSF